MSLNLNIVFRNPQVGFFSIEKVFYSILPFLDKSIKVDIVCVPLSGASPLVILKNCLFLRSVFGFRHITGDAYYLAICRGRKTIITVHDVGSVDKGFFLKRMYLRLFWFWLPALFVKRITVISEFTKSELLRIVPFAKNKINVVPNPVGSKFKFESKEKNNTRPVILCIGTKENKNLSRIIDAVAIIDCKLHIIGKLYDSILIQLQKTKVDFENSFNLTDDEVLNAYKNCDLLCFPSTYEGFGMPIIEAQAVGRPVLTSNFGAMKEISKESACLVDPFDIYSIREGLLRIISDTNYYKSLVELGLDNVKLYQPEIIAKEYLNIYKEIWNN